jgi:multiple sugar transport system permease protein
MARTVTEIPRPATRRSFGARFLRAGYPYFLLSPSLLVLLLVGVYPFVFMIVLSFRKLDFRRLGTAGDFIGLENYRSLFDEPVFFSSLKTTAFIVFTSVPLELVLGFAMAYLFNRNFPLKRLAVTITIIPTVLAPIAIAVMWKILLATPWGFLMYNGFYRLGMFEDVSIFGSPGWALAAIIAIDVWEWTPFMFLVFMAGLGGLPQRPYEAAAVDGASAWQTFWYLTLPLLSPFILVMLFIRLIDAFKIFDTIYVLTKGGPGVATESISIFAYRFNFEYWKLGESSALAVVIFLLFFTVFGFLFTQLQKRYRIF